MPRDRRGTAMTTASARFRIGKSAVGVSGPWTWGSYDAPIDADASDYIKVEFESLAGIETMSCEVSSADEVTLAAGVPTMTVDPATRTATGQLLSTVGATYILRAIANPNTASAVQSELAVHVLTAAGHRLIAVDETDQSSRAYYWTAKLNTAIRYGELPTGTLYQHLEHNGVSWAPVNGLTFPKGGGRVIKIAQGDTIGDDLSLLAGDAKTPGSVGGNLVLASGIPVGANSGSLIFMCGEEYAFGAYYDSSGNYHLGFNDKAPSPPARPERVSWTLEQLIDDLDSTGLIKKLVA